MNSYLSINIFQSSYPHQSRTCSATSNQAQINKLLHKSSPTPIQPKEEQLYPVCSQTGNQQNVFTSSDKLNENKKYLTFNDMKQELVWLIQVWRKQTFIKIVSIFMVLICVCLLISSEYKYQLFYLFLSLALKALNSRYVQMKNIKIWTNISEFCAIFLLSQALFISLLKMINSQNLLLTNVYADYTKLPALNTAFIFTFLVRLSHKIVIPQYFKQTKENIANLFSFTLKNILENIWNMKFIILRIQIIIMLCTFLFVAYFLQINTKSLFTDLFRPSTLLCTYLGIILIVFLQQIVSITIFEPIKIKVLSQSKFDGKNILNMPHVLELLRLQKKYHRQVPQNLIYEAYETSLEWLVIRKINQKNSHENIRDFMKIKINNSNFYYQYIDIFVQFVTSYLQSFLKKDIESYNDIENNLFVLKKINRASLMIDLIYPFKKWTLQVYRYLAMIKILNHTNILSSILQILSGLFGISNFHYNDENFHLKLKLPLRHLNQIYGKLGKVQNIQKNHNLCYQKIKCLNNKIERVLVTYSEDQSYMPNKM